MVPIPIRAVCVFVNPEKERARKEFLRLKRWLLYRRIRTLAVKDIARAQAVVTLGGDGTILAVASEAAKWGVPVFGVNIGRMGFMTALGVDEMYKGLAAWLSGGWVWTERLMLEVKVPRLKTPMYALNEAVVRLGSITRVTTISVAVDGEDLGSFTGDGVIVATPTGSTAYSLAAQGPVVHPHVDSLILTPVCPHSLTQRPLVYPADQTVELKINDRRLGNDVQLCIDGHLVFKLRLGDVVSVRASADKLKLLHDPKVLYYGVLKEKLMWGGR